MKTDIFPINFFKSFWLPKNVLKGRKDLNWFQIFIAVLFLNGLLMIPVSLHFSKMDAFPIEGSFPNAFELVDDSVWSQMENASFQNGQMELTEGFYMEKPNGVVGGNLTETEVEEALKADNAILFLQEEMVIKEGDKATSNIRYTKDFSVENVSNVEEFKQAISEQWFYQNQTYVVGSMIFVVFILLLVNFLFIVLGSAFFVYLTRKSSSIKTFKESINLVLNAAGLSTVISMIVGLISFDIITIILIQSFGLIFMLLAIFLSSRFQDEPINSRK
ncbi:DUF1189 family protein [Caldibacillus lycopersici]|uniref:DUF1189 family protein n=1 Tax=Perspicuibacillus lycopersici TaxID=1325689 RepID=A0AAE3LLL4_9BACI|nr:DUF1189 family protein [Perspicuibacillus lycopersici]MCU9612460.1 DUF1189 family protein [Perspicuibacillus lycopersici]